MVSFVFNSKTTCGEYDEDGSVDIGAGVDIDIFMGILINHGNSTNILCSIVYLVEFRVGKGGILKQ